jgi:hypothetical protein
MMITHWETAATLAAQHQHELRDAAARARRAGVTRTRRSLRSRVGRRS